MAIYHLSFTIIGRSSGRSSTAAAAYRSGTKIHDERTGETHDYIRKKGILFSEILAPENVPSWIQDRSQLWNAIESVEKRKDSQLCRELNVALPMELNDEQKISLTRDFAKSFVSEGMVADLAIHDDGKGNPHAHIMLTLRELSADGFGMKNRTWNDREKIEEWRRSWEEICNDHLKRAGVEHHVDRRTLEAQGINREPTMHLGPNIAAMERRGIETDIGEENRRRQTEKNVENVGDLFLEKDLIERDLKRLKQSESEAQKVINITTDHCKKELKKEADEELGKQETKYRKIQKELSELDDREPFFFKGSWREEMADKNAELKKAELAVDKAKKRLQDLPLELEKVVAEKCDTEFQILKEAREKRLLEIEEERARYGMPEDARLHRPMLTQSYKGRVHVVDEERGVVYQKTASDTFVRHELSKLSRVPERGEEVRVSYKGTKRGEVEAVVQQPVRERERGGFSR